ncbi:matrixin family metalloprotease [Pseudomonas ovata]|uniref:matrixin family metalloprotease n=1 Tax=Pseudomonas ovata TaxID=1839709 RepID=UPI000D69D263|nr:matrixin family metalloprotease [Pseudomonas ovata]
MTDSPPLDPRLLLRCALREAEDYHASHATAIKENPDNGAIDPTDEADATQAPGQPRLLIAFNKYWARGRTLTIRFLQDPPDFITGPIIAAANQWLAHANLKFDFVAHGPSDIRIGFNEHLNWSELGTDALLIAQDQPTMELNVRELFDDKIQPLPELPRIVLHEFGHALGAVHEHQHPRANIPWNIPLLTALLKQVGYSEALIQKNFLEHYEAADFKHAAYDRDSVMHFDIPNGLTLGDFEVLNIGKTLSAGDIQMMRSVYPDRSSSKYGGA